MVRDHVIIGKVGGGESDQGCLGGDLVKLHGAVLTEVYHSDHVRHFHLVRKQDGHRIYVPLRQGYVAHGNIHGGTQPTGAQSAQQLLCRGTSVRQTDSAVLCRLTDQLDHVRVIHRKDAQVRSRGDSARCLYGAYVSARMGVIARRMKQIVGGVCQKLVLRVQAAVVHRLQIGNLLLHHGGKRCQIFFIGIGVDLRQRLLIQGSQLLQGFRRVGFLVPQHVLVHLCQALCALCLFIHQGVCRIPLDCRVLAIRIRRIEHRQGAGGVAVVFQHTQARRKGVLCLTDVDLLFRI